MVTEDLPNFAEHKWISSCSWQVAGKSEDLPPNPESGSSAMFLIGDTQIAVYRFPDNKLYATQNMCGHRRAFILSEGTLERDKEGIASVSCPVHRRKFALEGERSGYSASKSFHYSVAVFDAKEQDGKILLRLPKQEEMDKVLGTSLWCDNNKKDSFVRPNIKGMRPDHPLMMDGCPALDSRMAW